MFRALLWKEWRELWVLPVMAVPLAGISLFFTRGYYNRLDPTVWEMAFGLWLSVGAVYIASHIYAREKETGASRFLFSKPIDKFRLWWIRLLIGLSVILVIAFLLFLTAQSLSHLYIKPPSYEHQRSEIIRKSIYFAIYCFSLSSFFSAVSKKQLAVFAGTAFGLVFLSYLRGLIPYRTFNNIGQISGLPDYVYFISAFLFIALVLFTRKNMWRSTWWGVLAIYTSLAILCFTPASFWVFQQIKQIEKEQRPSFFTVYKFSADGRYCVILTFGKDYLLDVVTGGITPFSHNYNLYGSVLSWRNGKVLLWGKGKFSSSRWTLMDMNGTHEKDIRRGSWGEQIPQSGYARLSNDAKYIGLTSNSYREDGGWVAIIDVEGNEIIKYHFPKMEMVNLWPLGWDGHDRFYFQKVNIRGRSTWRIGISDDAPEPVPVPKQLPFDYGLVIFIPHGDWLDCWETQRTETHFLYEVTSGRRILLQTYIESLKWSTDGSALAYLEKISGDADEGTAVFKLVVQEPPGKVIFSASLPPSYAYWLNGFSPSNQNLLISQKKLEPHKLVHWESSDKRVFSLTQKEFTDVTEPAGWAQVNWIAGDRLLWNVRHSLIMTNADGSNPQELFSMKDDKVISLKREGVQ